MFILLDFIIVALSTVTFFFLVAKVLTLDKKFYFEETVYIVLVGFITAAIRIFVLGINSPNVATGILDEIDVFLIMVMNSLFLVLYFVKAKSRQGKSLKSAFILMALSTQIAALSDFTVGFFLSFFPSQVRPYPAMAFSEYPVQVIIHLLLMNLTVFAMSISFTKITCKLRTTVGSNSPQQSVLFACCMLIFGMTLAALLISHFSEYAFFEHGWSWHIISAMIVTLLILTGLFFYIRSITLKHERQQKELEVKSLQHYTEELERQHTSIRKFKHDYQNILVSMSAFLEEGDLEGLKKYYSTKIEPTSQIISNDDLVLEKLSKIKVREIKSIFAAKLMLAQNVGISTRLEAYEIIDDIPADSVTLVRILGIILDNAIEELTKFEHGSLWVACFKNETNITFIVQNTCHTDAPDLHRIWEPGFSTKGEGRGFGLSNLLELVSSLPNATLETSIEEGKFTQILVIYTK